MERSVEKRWTIAMVDEVAWGVGWGPEGDQVTPMTENEEDEFEQIPPTRKSSAAPSRSQSRHKPSRRRFDDDHGGDDADVFPETPEWQMEDTMRSRSAMEAASRRSTSRVERSMSRAPITSSRRHSRVRAAPTSRAASPPPSSATFNKKLSVDPSLPSPTTSSSSTTSSSASSPFDDSSFLGMSPLPFPHIKTTTTTTGTGAAVERGRRAKPQYYSHSRSPSPSIPPSTPVDLSSSLSSVVRFTSPDPASRQRESSRGRRRRGVMYEQHQQHPHPRSRQRRGVQPFQPGVGQLLSSTTDALEELDVLDERGGWNEEGESDVDEKEHEKDEGEEEEGILSPLRDLRETDEWVQVHHEHDLHHHEHHHDEHESVGPLPNTRRRVSPVRRTRTGHGRHRRPESTPPAMMKVPSPSGWSSSLLSSSYAGYSATTSSSRYYHAQKGRQGQGHGHGWGGHHRYRQPSPPPPPTPCLLVQMPSWMESSSQMQGQSQTHLGGRGRSEKRGGGFDDGASPNIGGNANSGNAQQQWGRVGRVGGRSGIVRSRSLGYEPRKEEAYLLRCV
ncbi:hypothetical protein BDN72DRAFT_629669 [Pluteus cervinus]|uniref:Uncharacterized protein n=1 Tax=Pluteus cervinus TaxID=181527 RepID=A0ACD3BA79_9AGAR|nr:hypothetical protein BDN72DRAFT_629669 [Pluteus cervinus]